jgi:plasmid stabilization system protein ParE
MRLRWTSRALSDLVRLHEFLAPANLDAAAKVVQALTGGAARLVEHPRIGERLEAYLPRDVRRMLIAQYELRYEIRKQDSYVLRIWHTREKR